MISEKQKILDTINNLPEDATWDDAIYTLYFHSKLEKSKDDIKNGRVMTLQELKQHINRLGVMHGSNNI